MSQDDSAAACGEGRAEEGSQIDAGDCVLRADGHDVRAGDLVVAVHEEGREVLAIGQRDERVKGAGAGLGVRQDRLGEAKRTTGLHEAHFVDGDFLERCFGRVHRGEGVAVVYCASSLSLATLEYLVHLDPVEWPDDLVSIRFEVSGAVAQAAEVVAASS